VKYSSSAFDSNIIKTYTNFFDEGVLVCEKNYTLDLHPSVGVPCTQIIKLMRHLVTKGYAKHRFNWRHNYWFLTKEGIEYFRKMFFLPENVVPKTHKVVERPALAAPASGAPRGRGGFRGAGFRGGRSGFAGSHAAVAGGAPLTGLGAIAARNPPTGGFRGAPRVPQ